MLRAGETLRGTAERALEGGDAQWAAELLELHLAAEPDDAGGE